MSFGGNRLGRVALAGGLQPVHNVAEINAALAGVQPSFAVDVAPGVSFSVTLENVQPSLNIDVAPGIVIDAELDGVQPSLSVSVPPVVSLDATLAGVVASFDTTHTQPRYASIGATLDPLAVSVRVEMDWYSLIDPLTTNTYYACDVSAAGMETIRVPISSWQATLQIDRASYVQAVIPAATRWADKIEARSAGEFVIRRGAKFEDGSTQERELARAPIGTPRMNEGPTNATLTITGYSTMPAPDDPGAVRTLEHVRSQTSSPGQRARCAIDWRLRPGEQADARGRVFVVGYINYYANTQDQYMDVGERSA